MGDWILGLENVVKWGGEEENEKKEYPGGAGSLGGVGVGGVQNKYLGSW